MRWIFFCFSPFVLNTGERHMNNSTQNIPLTSSSPHFLSSLFPFCHLTLFILVVFWWTNIWVLFSAPVLSVHINQHHSLHHAMLLLYKPLFSFLFNLCSLAQNRRQTPSFQIIVTYVFMFVILNCNEVFSFLSTWQWSMLQQKMPVHAEMIVFRFVHVWVTEKSPKKVGVAMQRGC